MAISHLGNQIFKKFEPVIEEIEKDSKFKPNTSNIHKGLVIKEENKNNYGTNYYSGQFQNQTSIETPQIFNYNSEYYEIP